MHKIFLTLTSFFITAVMSVQPVYAQACAVDTIGGTQGAGCKACGSGATAYCCLTNQNQECTCNSGSCSCTVQNWSCSGGTATEKKCFCLSGASCTSNAQCGDDKVIYNGQFDYCACPAIPGCTAKPGTSTLFCGFAGGGPTSAPGPTSGGGPTTAPTTAPTAVPPTATPTPRILGTMYADPNDGTVVVSGGMCTKLGAPANPVALSNVTILAQKASSGVNTVATVVGANYSIHGNLVSGATDYLVRLVIPTPGPSSTTHYVCGCPTTGSDYICQYTGLSANGTANFFVKDINLANAWWQTFGGSVYARDQIQTQIPVSTCDASGTCESALIVGNGTNTSGFAVLGTGGVLKTTTDGSDAYVQSAGSRTTANGAYAVGVSPGDETYDYFINRLSDAPASVTSLAQLKAAILAQASDSTGIYRYDGGDLLIDKDSSAIPLSLTGNKRVVVFVPGNIEFSNSVLSASPIITDVPVGSFLMFVTQGNITVDQTVGYTSATTNPLSATANLSGVFVADGQIIIETDGNTAVADRKFIGAGTFVGWDQNSIGNGIELQRDFQDSVSTITNSTSPGEAFVYRPDFVTSYPTELKLAHYNWQEIAPQR